jgi:dolichol-phosphate mannosyltransferase
MKGDERHLWDHPGVPGMLSVVIPAHNEEGDIAATIEEVAGTLDKAGIKHEILVVNDHSKDGTERVLQDLRKRFPSLRYENNSYSGGFGFAVRFGLARFNGDRAAVLMADGSDDPVDLVAYYRKMDEGYDCVFGSRFVAGARVDGYPAFKLFLNRMGNLFIRLVFMLGYNDTTNAFKLFSRETLKGLNPLLAHHFNLTVELPLKAITRGYSYAVVPTHWRGRKKGVSKFRIKEMGSRYFFIVLYCLLEKLLSREDYKKKEEA